jgi:hypothetical protein
MVLPQTICGCEATVIEVRNFYKSPTSLAEYVAVKLESYMVSTAVASHHIHVPDMLRCVNLALLSCFVSSAHPVYKKLAKESFIPFFCHKAFHFINRKDSLHHG